MDFVRDEDRSSRPSGVSIARQEHLKNKSYKNPISGYGSRSMCQTLSGVLYSVGYLSQRLKKGLEFLKGGYHADKTGERKAPCVDSLGAASIATLIHIPVNLILLD